MAQKKESADGSATQERNKVVGPGDLERRAAAEPGTRQVKEREMA